MSQYNSHTDDEYEFEFDSFVGDITLSRAVKNKKQSEAGKELKRLEKRRQTQLKKLNATNDALVIQDAVQQDQLDTVLHNHNTSETLSADEQILLAARLRQERILNRQSLKKVAQRQRRLKSKNTTLKIRNDISKKNEARLKTSAKIQENTQNE